MPLPLTQTERKQFPPREFAFNEVHDPVGKLRTLAALPWDRIHSALNAFLLASNWERKKTVNVLYLMPCIPQRDCLAECKS